MNGGVVGIDLFGRAVWSDYSGACLEWFEAIAGVYKALE